ncbi:MAG: methylmalonyl Co-A mutase-associated GTPase MeaB [Myxococcaceae bacterium]
MSRRPRLTLEAFRDGVLAGDRAVLAQAITLIESQEEHDQALARQLLDALSPHTGRARRVGITGVPGVGKSTFIDELGTRLTTKGSKVAVLAVDPSSSVSGGSILGDKTRMTRLSVDPAAFIRPSPSGLTLGGVARRTRETMLLCEAAGFDVVLIETVGVGQGETVVAQMVDCFLVLLLPGAGDELQGIKKGILELADVIAVNKADGDGAARATIALGDLKAALRYLPARREEWTTRAVAVSGKSGTGVDELWAVIEEHRAALEQSGALETQRAQQNLAWMWSMISERLEHAFRHHEKVSVQLEDFERQVLSGEISARSGADRLLALFGVSGVN